MYKLHSLILLVFVLCLSVHSYAQQSITLNETPDGLYNEMISNEHVRNDKGEGFCWHAKYSMNQYLKYYQLTKNTEWLDAAVTIVRFPDSEDGY